MTWPLRITLVGVLALTAACDGADVGAKVDSAVSAAKDAATEKATDAVQAQAEKQAAQLKAAADKALQEQTAKAKAAAQAAADRATALAAGAAMTAASAMTLPSASPLPSVAPIAAVASPLPSASAAVSHTVTGVLLSGQRYDVTFAYPTCASEDHQVGEPVQVRAGTTTVTGSLVSCSWSGDYRTASPVFALEVKDVPDAASYDVVIGAGAWTVSRSALAASGWTLSLS